MGLGPEIVKGPETRENKQFEALKQEILGEIKAGQIKNLEGIDRYTRDYWARTPDSGNLPELLERAWRDKEIGLALGRKNEAEVDWLPPATRVEVDKGLSVAA